MKKTFLLCAFLSAFFVSNAQLSPKAGVIVSSFGYPATSLAIDYRFSEKFSLECGGGYYKSNYPSLDLMDTLGTTYSSNAIKTEQATIFYMSGKYRKALGEKEKAYLTAGLRMWIEFSSRDYGYTDQEIQAYFNATGVSLVWTGFKNQLVQFAPQLGFEYYVFKQIFIDANVAWGAGISRMADSQNNKLGPYNSGFAFQPTASIQIGYTLGKN